ncbi:acyl carrier protein [Hyphomicrobium sp. CS1GBMeth3]|uniref:acyl carrier protein n=1 Tax=Hyphomicrobium sp. CS1GBMeth3 TaxID=1892845 RepID=UPI000930A3E9|nr:acyl carrier protein [Hyphomicrobium sp. CS1GBMeth3]
MTDAEILSGLTDIFRETFDDDSIQLTMHTTADDIDRWDSFNHINILVAAEEHFKIKFQTAEIEGLKNVGEFVHLIEKKTAKGVSA